MIPAVVFRCARAKAVPIFPLQQNNVYNTCLPMMSGLTEDPVKRNTQDPGSPPSSCERQEVPHPARYLDYFLFIHKRTYFWFFSATPQHRRSSRRSLHVRMSSGPNGQEEPLILHDVFPLGWIRPRPEKHRRRHETIPARMGGPASLAGGFPVALNRKSELPASLKKKRNFPFEKTVAL